MEAASSSRRASDAMVSSHEHEEQPPDGHHAISALLDQEPTAPALEDNATESHPRHVHQLEVDLAELNETAHAFKLLNEKQVAELNAKDILLARKNERVDELMAQLKARDAQLEAKSVEMQEREAAAKQLRAEVEELHDQLRKEEEDFSMVSAALEAKEHALAKKTQDLAAAGEVERQVRKDLDRSHVIIRRLEKSVEELHPEQADACLSPRSFHENQLIQLRDDAIASKTREVWLLTGQNDQLRAQLDDLETAMEQLQTTFVAKENDAARKQRRVEKLEAEIEALQVSRSQAEGREKAMEIATTQNQKLLLALEAQERVNEELTERAERAERECEQLRETHYAFLAKSAVSEAEVIHKTKEAEQKSSIVSGLQEKLQRERRALQEELASARMHYQLETEKMQSELVMRRNKQYELTLRLQDVDARLHHADDALETTSEQLFACKCRMEELERVLHDALQWKSHLEQQLQSQATEAALASDAQMRQLREAQTEITTLKTQLSELKEGLVKKLSLEKRLERDIQDFKQLLEAKEALVREQRERVNRLVHEVNRESQSRAELELERQLLREQLDRVREQMDGATRDVEAQKRRAEGKLKALQDKFAQLETECSKERVGKSKLVAKFAEAFTAAGTTAARSAWLASEVLDLRDCWLSDSDLHPLLRMLEYAPEALTRVDLRSNRITQDGMRAVTVFVKKLVGWLGAGSSSSNISSHSGSRCRVRDIDLRSNFVSLDGVRAVANGIESLLPSHSLGGSSNTNSSSSLIKSVVVKSGGRIECFADTRSVGEQTSGVPLLIVDVTCNFDAEALIVEARKANRRRVRETEISGGGGSFGSNNAVSTQRDLLLQETYGVDLVSSLFGSENGVGSVNARRKSGLFEKSRSLLPAAAAAGGGGAMTTPVSPSGDGASFVRSSSNNTTLLGTTQVSPVPGIGSEASSSRLLGSSSLPRLNG